MDSRDMSDVIKVQNEDELRLAQMGESCAVAVERLRFSCRRRPQTGAEAALFCLELNRSSCQLHHLLDRYMQMKRTFGESF